MECAWLKYVLCRDCELPQTIASVIARSAATVSPLQYPRQWARRQNTTGKSTKENSNIPCEAVNSSCQMGVLFLNKCCILLYQNATGELRPRNALGLQLACAVRKLGAFSSIHGPASLFRFRPVSLRLLLVSVALLPSPLLAPAPKLVLFSVPAPGKSHRSAMGCLFQPTVSLSQRARQLCRLARKTSRCGSVENSTRVLCSNQSKARR